MRPVFRLLSAFVILGFANFLWGRAPVRPVTVEPPKVEPPTLSRSDTVVYVRDGDLYTCALPGGATRRLTRDGGNQSPHWSPSGNWIIYYHQDSSDMSEYCLIRRDGTGRHTLPFISGRQPTYSFSPLTEEIAAVTAYGNLEVMPLEGGKLRRMVSASNGNRADGVSWSPDGRSLAYTIEHPDTFVNGRLDTYRTSLWQTRANGSGTPRMLYVSNEHEDVPEICGWSADSRYLLFWTLHTYPGASCNMDGLPLYACPMERPYRKARLLGREGASEVLSKPEFVRCSPTGSRVAVSVGGLRWWVTNKRIALMDLRNRSTRFVTSASLAATSPIWSPDGKRIAYQAAPNADLDKEGSMGRSREQMRLWIMDADGTRQKRLNSGPVADDMGPRWLSDNDSLLVAREKEEGDQTILSLWTIRADGSGLRCIAPSIGTDNDWHHDYFDLWSPRP